MFFNFLLKGRKLILKVCKKEINHTDTLENPKMNNPLEKVLIYSHYYLVQILFGAYTSVIYVLDANTPTFL